MSISLSPLDWAAEEKGVRGKKLSKTIYRYFMKRFKHILGFGFALLCLSLVLRPHVSGIFGSLHDVAKVDFSVVERSHELGIRHTHKMESTLDTPFKKIDPYLTATGASVSVVDINSDDKYDLFFPSTQKHEKNHLYINTGNGFKDGAKEYGLESFGIGITRSTFLDCDNDGVDELLLNTLGCPILLKRELSGKKYSRIPFGNGKEGCYWSSAINLLDLNRDGLIDIVMAGHLTEWKDFFTWLNFLPNTVVGADNGGPIETFENVGSCKFSKTENYLKEDARTFTLAIGAGDLRNSGNPDLWFATDFNNDKVYLSASGSGPLYFSSGKQKLSRSTSNSGMNADMAYLAGPDYPHVYVSHLYRPGYFIGGNSLWSFDVSTDKFINQSEDRGVRRCGWSWGAKFIDLNNDSFQDLVVANGHISGEKKIDYMFRMSTIMSSSRQFMSDYKMWPAFKGHSLSGHERDCVFLNRGDGFFDDISSQLDFDRDRLDGRGVATVDIDNSGQRSIVVANQKQRPHVYTISTKNKNDWIGFKMRGTKSNRAALGAKVKVTLKSKRVLVQELYPLNGYSSQSDGRLLFGLGKEEIDTIQINWPSGKIQTLNSASKNRYNLVSEPIN